MRFEGLLERHERGELAEEIVRMRGLDKERYAGLTAKDFHEQLRKRCRPRPRLPQRPALWAGQ